MLKKDYRLSSKYEFGVTKKYGKSATGKFFHLYYLKPQKYEGPTRIGVVVPNSYSKSAVKRNRLKRIFREIARVNFDKIKPGYWIIIYPRYYAVRNKHEEISVDFNKTLQEISLAG